jgi:Cof subfamily protein (haloacid dehalogenase superfamily)
MKVSTPYRLVALDLDGTLLNSNHQISDSTVTYLRELDEKGFIITLATGRPLSTVYDYITRLNFPHPLPVVSSNGAQAWLVNVSSNEKGFDEQLIFSKPVPEKVSRRVISLAKELGFVSQYYVENDIYADPTQPHHFELTEKYMSLTGCKTIYVHDDFEVAKKRGLTTKQLVLCRPEEQDEMISKFEKELAICDYLINGKPATIVRGSYGWFLEVLHPDVCKGTGLVDMCHHLNISLEQTIAFGDGDNDIEFLQYSGKGIVMKNGRDVCKRIADEVIEFTNDEDGVRKTLQRMEREGLLGFAN